MLKYSHDNIDWNKIDFVGFDLDGTLYDEFDFISQVYRPIAIILGKATNNCPDAVYDRLLRRWIDMGSSYNKIFDEILLDSSISSPQRSLIISQCIDEFRNFEPSMHLTSRVEKCLDWLSLRFPLFLVTDGGQMLQQTKINSLGLSRWIKPENISISGSFEPVVAKPNPLMLSKLGLFRNSEHRSKTSVYFGDRKVDCDFANNCGFEFVSVKVMIPSCQFLN